MVQIDPRSPVTIVVTRFEDLIARGLRSLLAEDPSISASAFDVPHAHISTALSEHEPDVALLNYGSLRSPVELNTLAARFPATRLLLLASRPAPAECNQMLAFGASGCLAKDTQSRDILTAIHMASRGLRVLPRSREEHGAGEPLGPERLTPREADVLEQLQHGASNAEIAHALTIGVETVRTHARNIYRKLGVGTRRELVLSGERPERSPHTTR